VGASPSPRTPTGTLTRKTHSQPNPWVRTPPSTQPAAPPPAAAAVHTPRARSRPAPSGKIAVSALRAEGETIAAPSPCATRASTRASGECQAARQRRPREQGEPDHEQPPAVEVGRPSGEQQEAPEYERVGRDDPLQIDPREAQRLLYRGQGDGDDSDVQDRNELRHAKQGQRRPPTRSPGTGHPFAYRRRGHRPPKDAGVKSSTTSASIISTPW
jgi:hypothetical protein